MIGIIGLGKMGRAIAERLIDEGEEPIVWNRTREKLNGLSDVQIAESPAEVISRTDLVLSALADDAAIDAVYSGENGLLAVPLGGQVIVEMCTTSPERSQSLERTVLAQGGRYLECPVGGTIAPARRGQLLGLVGGDHETFEVAHPILTKITRRLEYLGPVGTGAAMKLAINLPLMVYWNALGEALGLALAQGIDVTLALDILSDSSGAIGAAKTRIPPIQRMLTDGDSGSANFTLATGMKDMHLMEALAVSNGFRHEVISAALSRVKAAAKAGYQDLDCSLVAAFGHRDVPRIDD